MTVHRSDRDLVVEHSKCKAFIKTLLEIDTPLDNLFKIETRLRVSVPQGK